MLAKGRHGDTLGGIWGWHWFGFGVVALPVLGDVCVRRDRFLRVKLLTNKLLVCTNYLSGFWLMEICSLVFFGAGCMAVLGLAWSVSLAHCVLCCAGLLLCMLAETDDYAKGGGPGAV